MLFYVDENNGPSAALTAPLSTSSTSISLDDATHFAAGSLALVNGEIISIGASSTITRARLGSTVDSHTSGAEVLLVKQVVNTQYFAYGFLGGSPEAASWSAAVRLPNMKLVAVECYVSNDFGANSPATDVCTTANADHGLRLVGAGATAGGARRRNVINANTALDAAEQIVSVTATTQDVTVTLPPESSMVVTNADSTVSVLTVEVYSNDGNTHKVSIAPNGTDTEGGSSIPYVLSDPADSTKPPGSAVLFVPRT
jgi:hypothetical protein